MKVLFTYLLGLPCTYKYALKLDNIFWGMISILSYEFFYDEAFSVILSLLYLIISYMLVIPED